MLTILIIIVLSLLVATLIALVTLRINGDDGKPWPHN